MKWGFDLDGVLAESPPAGRKKWGHMKGPERINRRTELLLHYARAKVLFRPEPSAFHVITARKNKAEVRAVTEQWLIYHFRRTVLSVTMLDAGRTLPNVIKFKSDAIRRWGITDFAEDNPQVVRGLRLALPLVHVWLFERGALIPDPGKK